MSIFQVYIILIVINLVYGIFVSIKNTSYNVTIKKHKLFNLDNLLGFVLLIDLFYIAINSKNISDLSTYEMIYDSGVNTFESGYTLLSKLGKTAGLDYYGFRTFLFAAGFILIWICLRKLKTNVNLVLGLYAIYPFTLDVIQNRNFLAATIVLFGIPFLFREKKSGSIEYIVCVVLASTIHRISIVYLLLLFAKKGRNEKLRKNILLVIVFLAFLLAALMRFAPGMTEVVINFLMSINSERTTAYTQILPRWGFLLFWTMELLYVLSAKIIISDRLGIEDGIVINSSKNDLANFVYWINLCCCSLFPLLLININFYRIYRNLSLINYIQLPLLLNTKNKQKKLLGIAVFVVALLLNISQNIGLAPENTYFPVLGLN